MEKNKKDKALKALIIYCTICFIILFILPWAIGLIMYITGGPKFD